MKRSWRIVGDAFPKERDIYREFARLNEKGEKVPHLPGCYFGGDVPRDSQALAEEYFKWKATAKEGDTWAPPSAIEPIKTRADVYANEYASGEGGIEMMSYVLTVTLFKRIGTKLRNFTSTRQFCIAIRDALESMYLLDTCLDNYQC